MSRMRHKKADGGVVDKDETPKETYAGKGSHVEKEADEKKHGGKVRKRGGHVEGEHKKMRLDRPGRKRGGGVGSDMRPLSTASKVTNASEHDSDTGNSESP